MMAALSYQLYLLELELFGVENDESKTTFFLNTIFGNGNRSFARREVFDRHWLLTTSIDQIDDGVDNKLKVPLAQVSPTNKEVKAIGLQAMSLLIHLD